MSGTIKPLVAKQVQRLRELMVDSADAPVNSVYKARRRSIIIGTGDLQAARIIPHQQDEIERLRRYRDSIGEALKDGRKLRETGEPKQSDVREIELAKLAVKSDAQVWIECSWCGAECSASGPRSRSSELFCSRSHRDASSRALRGLRTSCEDE